MTGSTRTRDLSIVVPHGAAPTRTGPGRYLFWLVTAIVALLLGGAMAVTIGPADVSLTQVWASVVTHLGLPELAGGTTVPPLTDAIVWQLRMPRVLTAAMVGAGLALSGAVMQSVTRNPLADP